MCPIITTSAFGNGWSKKLPAEKRDAVGHADGGDVLLEDRRHLRQVESLAGEVRVGQRDLGRQVALGRAHVDERLVVLPGELARDRAVGAVADPGHGRQELLQPGGVGIQRLEETGPSALELVLGQAGAERLGEAAPERDTGDGSPSRGCRRRTRASSGRGRGRSRACWRRYRRSRWRNPSAVSVSRKSRADRGCRPRRPLSASNLSGPWASSVNTPISMALRSVLDGQKARPVCRIRSGVRG